MGTDVNRDQMEWHPLKYSSESNLGSRLNRLVESQGKKYWLTLEP